MYLIRKFNGITKTFDDFNKKNNDIKKLEKHFLKNKMFLS